MKKQILNLVALLALSIAPLAVSATGIAAKLTAEIPFDFIAGNQSMPAGKYTLTKSATPGVMEIRSDENNAHAFIVVRGEQANQAPAASRLEFRRYGDQYFLGGIWTEAMTAGYKVVPSRSEREAGEKAKFLAGRPVKPEVVAVNAK